MRHTQNAMAIIILCSRLCLGEDVRPLEPLEWRRLARQLQNRRLLPEQLLVFSQQQLRTTFQLEENQCQRIQQLISRSDSLMFELNRLEDRGIYVVTRADKGYPRQLKKVLQSSCPPLFYCAGDPALLDAPLLGYVGSRAVGEEDIAFTKQLVQRTVEQGYGIVSGGAKGVDSAASSAARNYGGFAVEFLADSLSKKLRDADAVTSVQQGRLLLLSTAKPDTGFNAGLAMQRNRYIYAVAQATVVVKSDYNRGGTWAGASDCLKKQLAPVCCWNNSSYSGNLALIRLGALPIEADWNLSLPANHPSAVGAETDQLSLFD